MYPSDEYLVYANGVDASCYADPSQCYFDIDSGAYGIPTSGWIYNSNDLENRNWLLSPSLSSSYFVYSVFTDGVLAEYIPEDGLKIRPVLYLSSNVKITDGTGEQNSPYKLGL